MLLNLQLNRKYLSTKISSLLQKLQNLNQLPKRCLLIIQKIQIIWLEVNTQARAKVSSNLITNSIKINTGLFLTILISALNPLALVKKNKKT